MTMKELIENGLIKDDDKIRIMRMLPLGFHISRRGSWYQDFILPYVNEEIREYSWSREKGWNIWLESET